MKDYHKNKESLHLKYWDVNNLYRWATKLPVNGFKRAEDLPESDDDFIKNYNEKNEVGYFLEIDIHYPEELHELHDDLTYLPEKMKTENVEKLVANSFT